MDIAIVGTGTVGTTLGEAWSAKGHRVTYGTRDATSPKARRLVSTSSGAAPVVPIPDAVRTAEIVLLAVPWDSALQVVAAAGDLAGKVVIDPINAFTPQLGLSVGHTTSVAEEVARAAPGAKVVKAFNTLGVANVKNLRFGDQAASGFICGDDADAKVKVTALAKDLGFDVVDCGPLINARALEPLAMLWGQLAFPLGLGPNIAFKLLRR
jgi:predicted dinucleotide-binding enzyme